MAYIKIREMRYSTETTIVYAHRVIDKLVEAFSQVGVVAVGKNFETVQNLTNTTVLTNNNMPSWIADNASESISWFNTKYKSAKNNGKACIACLYWEIGEIKYSYFIGNAYSSSNISYYLGDTLVQNMYIENSTNSKGNLILGNSCCGYDNSYAYLGKPNVPDFFTIGKTSVGFHFYIKGGNSSSFNKYMGQVPFNYEDSIINVKYDKATKTPIHNNMVNKIVQCSFGNRIAPLINPSDGDILTGKYFAFDVFWGVKEGTIIGTAQETYCIPQAPGSEGNIINIGGSLYLCLRVCELNHDGYAQDREKVFVRVG